MRVIDGLEHVDPPLVGSVLTIGNFDGVHRGHQQLVAQAGLISAQTGGPVVLLTFEPHPLSVVAPQKTPARLATLQDKLEACGRAGVDIVVVAHSEPELLGLEAEDFIRDVIWRRFEPTHIVEGPSFGFGRGRKGTTKLLAASGQALGFKVHILEPVHLEIEEGETLLVSSSLIRSLLNDGKVRRARLCLGRPYSIKGVVERGDSRGRELGFPTANVTSIKQLVPGDGVYAGCVIENSREHVAAISIGTKPTFEGQHKTVEAHLLDYDGDLYDQSVSVVFERRLRDQQRFSSIEALIKQIGVDVERVRELSTDQPAGVKPKGIK